MSVITIQFGQCGNQLGQDLLSCISEDLHSKKNPDIFADSMDTWFDSNRSDLKRQYARAVLVDTEHKVVDYVCDRQHYATKSWRYKKENIAISKGGGAGNNWALGYGNKGQQLEEHVFNILRLEAEACDRVASVLSLLSSAGGTGSGVGSFIAERLKDEFPSKSMMHAIVLPYKSGEVATQNFNTLLSLSKLYDVSDMLIWFENDYLHKMCASLFQPLDIYFEMINSLISLKIGAIFQPIVDAPNHITDLISHLTPHPALKIVTIKSTPHLQKTSSDDKFKWEILLKHSKQMIRTNSLNQEPNVEWEMKVPSSALYRNSLMQYANCTANAIITRGPGMSNFDSHNTEFNNASLYPKWLPEDFRFYHGHNNTKFLGMDKFVALATNNHLICNTLNTIAAKALVTFNYSAYLHHYAKYGVDKEDFVVSFEAVDTIINAYKDLVIFAK